MNNNVKFIEISRLVKVCGDKIKFISNDNFQPFFISLESLYLLFSDKIRYVENIKIHRSEKYYIFFCDCDLQEELEKGKNIKVALREEDYSKELKSNNVIVLDGLDVIYKEKKIAYVCDVIFNEMQNVLVLKNQEGKEFMVPDTEFYIEEKTADYIVVRNIEELMKL